MNDSTSTSPTTTPTVQNNNNKNNNNRHHHQKKSSNNVVVSYEELLQQVWEENEKGNDDDDDDDDDNNDNDGDGDVKEAVITAKDAAEASTTKDSLTAEATATASSSSSSAQAKDSTQKADTKDNKLPDDEIQNKQASPITNNQANSSSVASSSSSVIMPWPCKVCTFINDAANIDNCSLCHTARPPSSFPQPPTTHSKNTNEPPAKKPRIDTSNTTTTKPSVSSSSSSDNKWTRPQTSTISCPICLTSDSPSSSSVQLSNCSHTFCETCLRHYITDKIKQGQVLQNQLICPSVTPEKCGMPLDPVLDVRPCFHNDDDDDDENREENEKLKERYDRLSLQRYIELENDMGCCPTPGCTFTFVWDNDNRKLLCPLCSNSYCLVCCANPWHSGIPCEEYQKIYGPPVTRIMGADEEDKAFVKFATRQKLRQCPKCQFFVEKRDGCDAMHCRCNFVFCFRCGGVRKEEDADAVKGVLVCGCPGMASMLQAHEGQRSHNLNDGVLFDSDGEEEEEEGDY